MKKRRPVGRTCPASGGPGFALRSRRRAETGPDMAEVETNYRCNKREDEWRVRAPANEAKSIYGWGRHRSQPQPDSHLEQGEP
jgi:hypothetical protein